MIGSTGTKATFEGKLRYLPIADKTFLHLFLFIYLFDFSFDTQQFFPRAKLKAPLKKKKKKELLFIYLFKKPASVNQIYEEFVQTLWGRMQRILPLKRLSALYHMVSMYPSIPSSRETPWIQMWRGKFQMLTRTITELQIRER